MRFEDAITLLREKGIYGERVIKDNELQFRFPKGMYFKCINCGNCCKEPVTLLTSELSRFEHTHHFFEHMKDRFVLKKDDQHDMCKFRKDGNCSVYEKRPASCRTYPWTFSINLSNVFTKSYVMVFIVDNSDSPRLQCKGYHLGEMNKGHIEHSIKSVRMVLNEIAEEVKK